MNAYAAALSCRDYNRTIVVFALAVLAKDYDGAHAVAMKELLETHPIKAGNTEHKVSITSFKCLPDYDVIVQPKSR